MHFNAENSTRTEGVTKAKNLEELDFDLRKSLAPRKSSKIMKNRKKTIFQNLQIFPKNNFRRQPSKFADLPKCALPKFRGDRSEVRGVNGRSKFVAASAGRAERK